MSQVRVGVIGCGYWGPNLIRNFVSLSDAEVVIVADLDRNRLEHIQDLYPKVKISEDYQSLFELNLDAAVIATPPATHFEIAEKCLMEGLHTFPKELSHRYRNWQFIVKEARNYSLNYFHLLKNHPNRSESDLRSYQLKIMKSE